MERSPSKACLKRKVELDRISNLPSDVIEHILSHLPIKEAAKTSVLSSKWRYKTSMLPHLMFDNQCVSTQSHTTFVNIVDQVLLLHIGPIHTFKLSHNAPLAIGHIVRWILHLSRYSIKELVLEVWSVVPYKMPSCLFSCQDLVSLRLYNCLIKHPYTFKGFRSLKSLDIDQVTLAQDEFDNLIVSCPLLESLTLCLCDGFTHLKIDAPNLQFFSFEGSFEHLNLEDTLNLVEVRMCLIPEEELTWVPESSSHLVKFFVHLPHIRRLSIEDCFLQYLADGGLPGKLPKPCLYLNFLCISIDLSDLEEVSTAQCLLRSTPALQELEISSYPGTEQAVTGEVNSWLDDNQNCSFSQLRLVKLTRLSGFKAELDFIRFLLLRSPLLERMTVTPASSVNGSSKLLKELLQCRRASAHAEIIYLGP